MRASVVIPTWNGAHLLPACLDSLASQEVDVDDLEVIVVDGGSRDGTMDLLADRYPSVRAFGLTRNLGFAGNVNAGIRVATGDVVLLLNNDAQASPGWVRHSIQALAEDERIGSVAARVVYRGSGQINSAGDGLTSSGRPFQRGNGEPDDDRWDRPTFVFGAMGGAAAYRRTMLEDVGLLDEYFFAYLEDVDLAFRAQLRGWACRYEPMARVDHQGSATGGGALASYYNGRNAIRLVVKNVPGGLLWRMLGGIIREQARRAGEAAAAWQGREARATLRGQLSGLRDMPLHIRARRTVQSRRVVSDAYILSLLTPDFERRASSA